MNGQVVTAVLGRFEPLVASGLAHALATDPRLLVVDSDLEDVIEASCLSRVGRVDAGAGGRLGRSKKLGHG